MPRPRRSSVTVTGGRMGEPTVWPSVSSPESSVSTSRRILPLSPKPSHLETSFPDDIQVSQFSKGSILQQCSREVSWPLVPLSLPRPYRSSSPLSPLQRVFVKAEIHKVRYSERTSRQNTREVSCPCASITSSALPLALPSQSSPKAVREGRGSPAQFKRKEK